MLDEHVTPVENKIITVWKVASVLFIFLAAMLLRSPPVPATGAEQTSAAADTQAVEHVRALMEQGHLEDAQQALEPWLTLPHRLTALPFLHARAILYREHLVFLTSQG